MEMIEGKIQVATLLYCIIPVKGCLFLSKSIFQHILSLQRILNAAKYSFWQKSLIWTFFLPPLVIVSAVTGIVI